MPGVCHTLSNNTTSPRKYLTKPGLFQLNMRDTVERCPQSGLASGVYIENSILFLALILDLKASVPYHHCLADDADYPWLWRFAGTNQPGEQEETEIINKNGTVTKKSAFF